MIIMPIDREITRPMLGTNQEPSAITWKSSLRSPIASPRVPRESRSKTRSGGSVLLSSVRSRTPSPMSMSLNQSSKSVGNMRSSRLSASFNKSTEMKQIENDYIKNLQQQVYFLELEANYLREQAKKASDMHPKMTAEAERMLSKLRELQLEVDDLQAELRRKEASVDLISSDKSNVLALLAEEQQEKERIKEFLQEEMYGIKIERDRVAMDNARLDIQVSKLLSEKNTISSKLRESQNMISVVKEQLNERTEQHRNSQLSLEKTQTQCIDAKLRAQKIEDHYLNTTQREHDRQINEYKDELRLLRHQLKEEERQSHDERFLKNKTQDDNEQLSKANFILKQQIDDMESQLIKEKQLRDDVEESHTEDLVKLSVLSDQEKEINLELRITQQELIQEKERCDRYLEQLKRQQEVASDLESTNNSVKMSLVERESTVKALKKENSNLRHEIKILTDEVADLHLQLTLKDNILHNGKQQIRELEQDLNLAVAGKRADESIHTEKWREFESLIDGMKQLTRTMSRTTGSTKSPRTSANFS